MKTKNPNRVKACRKIALQRFEKKCIGCQARFNGTHKQIWCSRNCKEEHKKTKTPEVYCLVCEKKIDNSGVGRAAIYCSMECKTAQRRKQRGNSKRCVFCRCQNGRTEFSVADKSCCSRECMLLYTASELLLRAEDLCE